MLNQNQTESSSSSTIATSNTGGKESINLDCSHAELAAIVARHYESKLDASEEEIVPSFVEYIMAYSGGNLLEEAKKVNTSHTTITTSSQPAPVRERRTRKRTRRVGWESSDDENGVDAIDREAAPSALSNGRRTNANSNNNNNNGNNKNNNSNNDDDDDGQGNDGSEDVYCLCRKEGYGEMIACDNPNCEIEWFHIGCVNVDPKAVHSRWFCPNCARLQR